MAFFFTALKVGTWQLVVNRDWSVVCKWLRSVCDSFQLYVYSLNERASWYPWLFLSARRSIVRFVSILINSCVATLCASNCNFRKRLCANERVRAIKKLYVYIFENSFTWITLGANALELSSDLLNAILNQKRKCSLHGGDCLFESRK